MCEYTYCVINPDGTYAGIPCLTYEEARELMNAREGRRIFELLEVYEEEENNDVEDWERDLEMTQAWERRCEKNIEEMLYDYDEIGYNPYMGYYDEDC